VSVIGGVSCVLRQDAKVGRTFLFDLRQVARKNFVKDASTFSV
jgi:hypothetical protein